MLAGMFMWSSVVAGFALVQRTFDVGYRLEFRARFLEFLV